MNNQTINRLYKQDGNLLINPFLEQAQGTRLGGFMRANNWLYSPYSKPFLETPGWTAFGIAGGGNNSVEAKRFNSANQATNPFTGAPSKAASRGIQVYGNDGYVTGIMQRIKGGKNLVGRKVRISGSYRVVDNPPNTGGISIWVMGKLVQVTATTPPVLGPVLAGEVPGAYPSFLFTDTVGGAPGFDVNTLPGDTLFIQNGMSDLGNSFVPRGLYEITHSPAPSPTNVNVVASGHGLNGITGAGTSRYMVARGNCAMNSFGIRIDHGTVIPGAVVHLTPPGQGYDDDNLINPFFDQLLPVPSDVSTLPDPASDAASVYLFGDYVKNNHYPYPESWEGYWEERNYTGGFEAWVIPADEWSTSVNIGGKQVLFNEVNVAGGTVYYFEEIVEIDASLLVTDDDLWLGVFPIDPRTNTGEGVHSGYNTDVYALSLELVPEDDDPEDTIYGRLAKGLNPSLFTGIGLNHAVADKFLVPKRYPISFNSAQAASLGALGSGSGKMLFHRFGGAFGIYPEEPGIGTDGFALTAPDPAAIPPWNGRPFWVPVPRIPSGAIVTSFGFHAETEGLDPSSDLEVRLWQVQADFMGGGERRILIGQARAGDYNPAHTFTLANEDRFLDTGVDYGAINEGDLRVLRNRVGLWVSPGADSPDYGYTALVGAEVWLEFIPNAPADTSARYIINTGFVDCLVDPRVIDARWTG